MVPCRRRDLHAQLLFCPKHLRVCRQWRATTLTAPSCGIGYKFSTTASRQMFLRVLVLWWLAQEEFLWRRHRQPCHAVLSMIRLKMYTTHMGKEYLR
ncbi:hypothetical protein BD626DRAFT_496001 [Schizophyllum amplum]|uniref:Uncharacterized protein n=1 Tax=Schizophyllum amplum TaxID=97359 RepID=A0A550CEM8_9AGAR|nr:hypothetical protein BD626DRAFT_496001 [Auriculariopsis ampla]